MDRHISAPVGRETAEELRAGDYVYITGTIYTARDAAHKRMYETLREGGDLPINIEGQAIYYMGPSPAREGRPIGSAGHHINGTRIIFRSTIINILFIFSDTPLPLFHKDYFP